MCTYANSFQGDHGKRKLALESASRRQKLPRNAGHSPIRLRKSVTSESDGLELSALEPLSAHDIPNEKQHQEGDGECPADDQSRIPSLAEDRVAGAWFTDEVGVELRESNGKDRDAGDQSWPRRDAQEQVVTTAETPRAGCRQEPTDAGTERHDDQVFRFVPVLVRSGRRPGCRVALRLAEGILWRLSALGQMRIDLEQDIADPVARDVLEP